MFALTVLVREGALGQPARDDLLQVDVAALREQTLQEIGGRPVRHFSRLDAGLFIHVDQVAARPRRGSRHN